MYEPLELEFLRKEIKMGYKCLNIGANVGLFAVELSRLVGKYGKITAVEPRKNLFQLLKLNLKINDDDKFNN